MSKKIEKSYMGYTPHKNSFHYLLYSCLIESVTRYNDDYFILFYFEYAGGASLNRQLQLQILVFSMFVA